MSAQSDAAVFDLLVRLQDTRSSLESWLVYNASEAVSGALLDDSEVETIQEALDILEALDHRMRTAALRLNDDD